MKIELGTINGNTTEEAQALAQKLFGDLPAIGPYKNLYLSVPHLKSWKESKPEHPSKTTIEMYIFSSPDDSTSCQYYETSTPYNLKGKSYTFLHNQADRITTFEPYEDYDEMADDAGVPLAYRKDNRVWILMDMFHDIHNEAPIADFMTELVKFLEGREHYGLDYVSLIVGASSQIGKDTLRKLKMDAKQGELDCITSQDTYVKYCKEMVQRNKRVDDFKILDKKDMKVMAERLLNHKFIAKIMPYEGDDGIVIITKEIVNGPFKYGAWKIIISPSVSVDRAISQLKYNGICHPYQYSHEERVCLGGFLGEIVADVGMGKWDEALNYYLLWVTNYTPTTQIHSLIPFLEEKMGFEKFHAELNKLLAPEITPETHGIINISSIYGKELTVIAPEIKTKAPTKKVVKLW